MVSIFDKCSDLSIWVKEVETDSFYCLMNDNKKLFLEAVEVERSEMLKRCISKPFISTLFTFNFHIGSLKSELSYHEDSSTSSKNYDQACTMTKPILKNGKIIAIIEILKVYDISLTDEKMFYLE